MNSLEERSYWNPYLAGFALGLVLLLSFIITGHGLGASGAFTSLIVSTWETISPEHVQANSFYKEYTDPHVTNKWSDWYVIEVAGMLLGGFISAKLAGRVSTSIDKGKRISSPQRMAFAFIGGGFIGIGSKLARGCTSGQGLSGGALLSVGGWIFLISVFISAYAVAYFLRKLWT